MITVKRLGIWMDHASAHLMEYTTAPIETIVVESTFTHESKEDSLGKSEHVMHNKEQHKQSEYYRKLGESIKNFEEVLLFGPTDAKKELFNFLQADQHFAKIKIEMKQTGKMTENQQHAFVRGHFAVH